VWRPGSRFDGTQSLSLAVPLVLRRTTTPAPPCERGGELELFHTRKARKTRSLGEGPSRPREWLVDVLRVPVLEMRTASPRSSSQSAGTGPETERDGNPLRRILTDFTKMAVEAAGGLYGQDGEKTERRDEPLKSIMATAIVVEERNRSAYINQDDDAQWLVSKWYRVRIQDGAVLFGLSEFSVQTGEDFITDLKAAFPTELNRPGWPKVILNDGGWLANRRQQDEPSFKDEAAYLGAALHKARARTVLKTSRDFFLGLGKE